ncbi:MAG: cytochrome c oxidase subunit 3 [Mucilaginibacter sp.]
MAQLQKEEKLNLGAKKFNMWIFIFTSFMFFAALTSGFIVYSGGRGRGIHLILPQAFIYSTTCILLSSVTLFFAQNAAKGLQFGKQRLFLGLTIALGILFFILQFYAWGALIKMGVYFTSNNASQSFIYVFTGAHLVHILAGVALLANTLWGSYKNVPQVKNLYKMELSSIFWHFVDIIWIYLYVFLLLNQN